MPNNVVRSFAKKSGKTVDEVEVLWKNAEDIASKNSDIDGEAKYAYIVGILKKMLSIDEDFGISVSGPAALDQGVPESGNSGVFANKIDKIQKRKYSFRDYIKDRK
jgi:hypothetical protein